MALMSAQNAAEIRKASKPQLSSLPDSPAVVSEEGELWKVLDLKTLRPALVPGMAALAREIRVLKRCCNGQLKVSELWRPRKAEQ